MIKSETNEKITRREEIKSLLKEVLYNSLAQAIIKIFLTPFIIIKCILFLFVFGSIGLTSYLVIESIMTYFTYGVSTTSRTIYETPTLFPKVTFCNANNNIYLRRQLGTCWRMSPVIIKRKNI